ncbi:hypothetical protein DNTS_005133, partial [Danionella cerebrum]
FALLLVCIYRNQVSAKGTGLCSSPPILCCAGQNNTCIKTDCFCDEYCMNAQDCCSDYIQTCKTAFIRILVRADDETAALNAVNTFILNIETTMKKKWQDCSLQVKKIIKT